MVMLMAGNVKKLVEVNEPLERAILEMEVNAGETAREVFDYILNDKENHILKMHDSERVFEHFAKKFEPLAETEEEVTRIYKEFKVLGDEITTLEKQRFGNLAQLHEYVDTIDVLIDDKLQPAIDKSSPDGMTKLEATRAMEINIDETIAAIKSYILEPSLKFRVKIDDSVEDFNEALVQYNGTRMSANENQWVNEVEKIFSEAKKYGNEIVMLTDGLHEKLNTYEDYLENIDTILDNQIKPLILQDTKRAAEEAQLSGRVTRGCPKNIKIL